METCSEIERPVDCIFDSPELKVEVFEQPNPLLDTPLFTVEL